MSPAATQTERRAARQWRSPAGSFIAQPCSLAADHPGKDSAVALGAAACRCAGDLTIKMRPDPSTRERNHP